MSPFAFLPAAEQAQCQNLPYDRWISPAGTVAAEFYRCEGGFLLRFPDQADFEFDGGGLVVRCKPTPDFPADAAESLYWNAINPLLANYRGELNLHGSGVSILGKAAGFVGHSRSGKTTLAGSFARAGHPLLTEDVLVLERRGKNFDVVPTRPVLRLFPDSASFLFGGTFQQHEGFSKKEMDAGGALPFAPGPSPLAALFLLGPGIEPVTKIERIAPAAALAGLIQHSFVLDVDDKQRLRAHFGRLSDLVEALPCYLLDYPRSYDRLGEVLVAVQQTLAERGAY